MIFNTGVTARRQRCLVDRLESPTVASHRYGYEDDGELVAGGASIVRTAVVNTLTSHRGDRSTLPVILRERRTLQRNFRCG